jgi:tetratricopeptide (TPR) repeat protein
MRRYLSTVLLVPCILLVCSALMTGEAKAVDTFQLGLAAARSGRLARAIDLWTRTLRADPKSYAAYVNRGSAYLESGHVLKGVEDWHRAQKYAPIFAYGLYTPDYVGQASRNRRVLNYAKPLELDPDHVPSVAMMGVAYLDLGRDNMAVELYEKSIDLTRNPMLKNHLHHWVTSIRSHSGTEGP